MRNLTKALAVVFFIVACGGAVDTTTTTATSTSASSTTTSPPAETTTSAPATTAAPTTTAAAGPTLMVAESDLGAILVDADGNTLYLFINDGQGEPTCIDDCALNWPPLTGQVSAGEGVDGSLLGAAGNGQVTYNGWPLYYYAADQAPGDINGQGVGEVWFVVDPTGNAIE